MIRRLALVSMLAAACGPAAVREVIPRLPGDGTGNVAAPPTDEVPRAAGKDPWTGRTDLIEAPPSKPPVAIKLPPVERWTMPNGLQVVVVKDDRLPTVAMQLAIRAGRSEEPLARLGVAELTANLLPKGTKKRSALQIAKAIDNVGGSITADATLETTWITCASLAKDARTCLQLLPEMVTQPSFAPDEIAKAKQGLLAEVSRRLDDTGQLAAVQVQNLLWGDGHVRGWVTSPATITALTRADLVAWHKAWFAPNNAILAIAGDVDVAKLKADLNRAFAGWKKATVPSRPRYPDPEPSAAVRLVDKPGLTQTQIRVAQLGLRHDDPRFFATLVWNDVLGAGGFSSRLMKVVRVAGGKTYGASSTFDRNQERGALVAATFTRTEETVATLRLVEGELATMAKDGPTDDEIADAIAHVAGSYALRMTGADDIAAALVMAEMHGLSQAYVTNFPVLVGQVSRSEAADAAREILTPRRLAVVLVGDGAKLAPALDAAGIAYERVAFSDPIGPQPGGDRPTFDPAKIAAAAKVLDAALAAKGARLTSLKTLRMVASGTLAAQGQNLPVTFKRTLVVPDRMRMDIEIAKQFNVVIAVRGDAGWQSGPAGVADLPASQLPALEQQRFVDAELVLLHARAQGVTAALIGVDKVDGAVCDVVHVFAPGGLEVFLLLDQQTHLLRQTRYLNGPAETRETFGDYRTVDGLQIAHHRLSVGGDEKSDLTVESVEVDPVVDDALFDKPAK
ncbi:MAG: insulinase family protein [Myxococcales bacterium]|nr:insulinase family protein [Myxococcales bacterium]